MCFEHQSRINKASVLHFMRQLSRYLQYSIRMGSDSAVGPCPSPDHPDEVLLLHSTCDGGITWTLLQKLIADDYTQPMYVSLCLSFCFTNSDIVIDYGMHYLLCIHFSFKNPHTNWLVFLSLKVRSIESNVL